MVGRSWDSCALLTPILWLLLPNCVPRPEAPWLTDVCLGTGQGHCGWGWPELDPEPWYFRAGQHWVRPSGGKCLLGVAPGAQPSSVAVVATHALYYTAAGRVLTCPCALHLGLPLPPGRVAPLSPEMTHSDTVFCGRQGRDTHFSGLCARSSNHLEVYFLPSLGACLQQDLFPDSSALLRGSASLAQASVFEADSCVAGCAEEAAWAGAWCGLQHTACAAVKATESTLFLPVSGSRGRPGPCGLLRLLTRVATVLSCGIPRELRGAEDTGSF